MKKFGKMHSQQLKTREICFKQVNHLKTSLKC